MIFMKKFTCSAFFCILFLAPVIIRAQESEKPKTASAAEEAAELAKKLANPIASLISVPFQNHTGTCFP